MCALVQSCAGHLAYYSGSFGAIRYGVDISVRNSPPSAGDLQPRGATGNAVAAFME
jgi:hypothetical protein